MSRGTLFFLLRKLHSFTGLFPIMGFFFVHLYINSGILYGVDPVTGTPERYNKVIDFMESTFYLPYIEWLFIFIPLGYHAIYGLIIILWQSSYNLFRYNYSRNWWYVIQRVSGFIIFLFLLWHLWELRVAKALGIIGPHQFFNHLMNSNLFGSRLGYLVAYTIGVIAASFHVSNGLWGFAFSWGIIQGRKTQKIFGYVTAALGVVIVLLWFNVVYYMATSKTLIPVEF